MTSVEDREPNDLIAFKWASMLPESAQAQIQAKKVRELQTIIDAALTTKEQQVWRDILELSRQSVKKSMAAGLSVSAAEILLRRLELKIESAAKEAEGKQ